MDTTSFQVFKLGKDKRIKSSKSLDPYKVVVNGNIRFQKLH